jgi:hypothetical protein
MSYLRQKYAIQKERKSAEKEALSSYEGAFEPFSSIELLATVFL